MIDFSNDTTTMYVLGAGVMFVLAFIVVIYGPGMFPNGFFSRTHNYGSPEQFTQSESKKQFIYHPEQNLCLHSSHANAHLAPCDNSDTQEWTVETDDPYPRIKSVFSAKCLSQDSPHNLTDCANASTYFTLAPLNDKFTLKKPDENKCFQPQSNRIVPYDCNASISQLWKSVDTKPADSTIYRITDENSGGNLTVSNSNYVKINAANDPSIGKWKILQAPGTDRVKLKHIESEKCLANAPAFVSTCNNPASNWIRDQERLVSPLTHKCLESDGVNLKTEACTPQSTKWKFNDVQ